HRDAGRAFLRAGRYAELVEVLLAGAKTGTGRERAKWLVKAADIMDRHLGLADDAVGALSMARALDDSDRATATLREILARHGRWVELAGLLAEDEDESGAVLLERAMIAEAVDDEAAVDLYRRALDAGEELAW